MDFRSWRWPQWLILIGIVLVLMLGGILIYVIIQPKALVYVPPTQEIQQPTTGLPSTLEGSPDFPTSVITPGRFLPSEITETLGLDEIQDFRVDRGPDLIAKGGVTQIQDVSFYAVDNITLASNGTDVNYYDADTKRFYRLDENGNITKMGDQIFAEVESVFWADNGSDSIVEFPDGSNVAYNFDTGEQITLPSHWEDFDFDPGSRQIAFKSYALDEDENWLAVADKNGSSARQIEHLGSNANKVDVDWAPNNQVIATFSEADGLSNSNLYFVGFNGERFPLSKLHGLNFEGSWTPNGEKLVYSVMHQDTNFNPTLWMVDGTGSSMGQSRKQIGLQTWSWKCVYASSTQMYCGVPQYLPRGAGLIPSVADEIPDDIYSVNISTGVTARIAVPVEQINVGSLQLNDDQDTLYIHDRLTGKIRKVALE